MVCKLADHAIIFFQIQLWNSIRNSLKWFGYTGIGSYAGAYAIGAIAGASMAAGGAIGAQSVGGLALNGVSAASKLVGGTLVGGGMAIGTNAAMDIGNNGQFDSTAGENAKSFLEGAALSSAAEALPSLFSAAKGVASKIGQFGKAGATSTPEPIKMNLQLFGNKGGVSTAEGAGDVVHGNSALSTKVQHGYEIIEKESGDVVKTGISGRPLNQNFTSPRANSQVNAWNKAAGFDKYDASVVQPNMPGRQAALDWETNNAMRLWEEGNSMSKHKIPSPWDK